MNGIRAGSGFAAACLCFLLSISTALAEENRFELQGDHLAVEIVDTPLSDALFSIGETVGFEVVTDDDWVSPTISLSTPLSPAIEVVAKLLQDVSVIMEYSDDKKLARIFILSRDGTSTEPATGTFSTSDQPEHFVNHSRELFRNTQRKKNNSDEPGNDTAEILYHSDPLARRLAVSKLGKRTSRKALPILAEALLDTDPDVRQQTVITLGKLTHTTGTIELLGRAMQFDSDVEIRRMAANRLSRMGGQQVITLMQTAQADVDEEIREIAADTLERLEQPDS